MNKDSENIETVLKDYFSRNPRDDLNSKILLVYLFGSQARGDARPKSDIDLAFLFRSSPTLDEHAQIQANCCRLLKTDRLDVVILNDASPLLRYEVVTEGRLLYQAVSDEEINDFELRVRREFFDTEHLRQVQDRYLREKLLGVPSGF